MSNQPTPTQAPTPAEVLRVTCDDSLTDAARAYLNPQDSIRVTYSSVVEDDVYTRYLRGLREYERVAATYHVTVDELMLAVRVMRHLATEKSHA